MPKLSEIAQSSATIASGDYIVGVTSSNTVDVRFSFAQLAGGLGSGGDGNKGDITVSASGTIWTINLQAVTYPKIQNVSATSRFLGRISAGSGSVEELTGTQATTFLDVFTPALKGLVPPSGGNPATFLNGAGVFAVPPTSSSSGSGSAPGGAINSPQYNAGAGTFGGFTNATWDDTNGSLTMLGQTVTANNPTFNITQTWNSSVVQFAAAKINIVDTQSLATSLLDQRQVGGVDKWAVRKDGVVVTGTWGATTIGASVGGTGQTTLTAHGVLLGNGTGAISQTAAGSSGTLLSGQSSTVDPIFTATPQLGSSGTGVLGTLALGGNLSGLITIKPQAAAGTYNFNLPITAGSSGQLLQSQGGGTNPMLWTFNPVLGSTNSATTGSLGFTGGSSGVVTVQSASQTGTYSFILPITAGTTGQILVPGSSVVPMSWTYDPVLGSTAAANTGSIGFVGGSSGVVTVQGSSATNTYTFTLPTTIGSSGQSLIISSITGTTVFGQWGTPGAATGTVFGSSVTTIGAPAIWTNATGTAIQDGRSALNILAYGGNPNGLSSLSVSSCIQAIVNAGYLAYLPKGKYYLTTGVTLQAAIHGNGIIGDGPWTGDYAGATWTSTHGGTLLVASSSGSLATGGDCIAVSSGATSVRMENFTVTRAASGVSSGYGLSFSAVSGSNQYCQIYNCHFNNHFIGAWLNSPGGFMNTYALTAENNTQNGFRVTGQGYICNLFSANNGQSGFAIDSNGGAGISQGQFTGWQTFGNGAFGIVVTSNGSSDRVEALRLSNMFIGADNQFAEIFFDSRNTLPHRLTNVYVESNSSIGCVYATSQNADILMSDCTFTIGGGTANIVELHNTGTLMSNCWLNGAGATGYGINFQSTAMKASVMGCRVANISTGVFSSAATAITLVGNNLGGSINVTATTYSCFGNY